MKVNELLVKLREDMGRPIGVTLLFDNEEEFIVQSVEGLQVQQAPEQSPVPGSPDRVRVGKSG